jgi:hypothetical protein
MVHLSRSTVKVQHIILGFQSMNYNSVYAQMTRGKSEKMLSMAMATLAGTLGNLLMMFVCI